MPGEMSWIKSVLIGLDQFSNAVLGGWPDETLSSRCWRLSLRGVHWPRKLVDGLLFLDKDHCKCSYESERLRRQMPPDLRDEKAD